MDIKSAQAALGYATKPMGGAQEPGGVDAMARAAEDFMAQMETAEAQAASAVTGGGDPHAVVTALAETQLAVEATVAVRDKVVEAYQELLRMPV